MIKTDRPIPRLGESITLNGWRNGATLGGEEGPTIPPSKTFWGKVGVAGISGRELRNPFLRMPFFAGGSTTFFARGSAIETLLTAKSTTIFEAFKESESSTLFHFNETLSLSTLVVKRAGP